MKALVLIAATLWVGGCPPSPLPPPPSPPPPVMVVWHVYVHDAVDMSPVVDATVFFNEQSVPVNGDGYAAALLPLGLNGIVVTAAQYHEQTLEVDLQQETETVVNLERVPPPTPRVYAIRTHFQTETGLPWRGDSVTAFELFHRWLDGDTEGVSAFLDSFPHANTVRVFGMWTNSPTGRRFDPTTYGDRYFTDLSTFASYLQSRGTYLAFTAITDAQVLMPSTAVQRAFLVKVGEALRSHPNVFLETCNEPFKNGCDVFALMRAPGDITQATGDYGDHPTLYRLDYMTWHPERDSEWPRKTRADELAAIMKVPVWIDEPMGAAEVGVPGRRSHVAEDFFDFAAGCALHASGCTFHSDAGLTASLPGPNQARARDYFFDALREIPPVVAQWSYTRGGLADNPLEHDDAMTLRTFCQVSGNMAVCQAVRPQAGWRAVSRGDWRIVRQAGPGGRLIFLGRSTA